MEYLEYSCASNISFSDCNRLARAATFGVKFPGSQNSKVTQVLQRKTFTPGRPKVFLKPAVLVLHMLVDVDV